jgi:hypothetical protein
VYFQLTTKMPFTKTFPIIMLVFGVSLSLSLSTLFTSAAFALPADIELDRYLLATQKHIDNQDYETATTYLQRIETLKSTMPIKLPPEFHYYYGLVLQHDQHLSKARARFETYVIKAGKEGAFYQQALEAITATEEAEMSVRKKSKHRQEQQTKRSDIIDQLNQTGLHQDTQYDAQIKELYLSDNTIKALVLHINSLLTTYPYSRQRIQTNNNTNAILYKISVNKNDDIIVQQQDNTLDHPQISSLKYPIYGANPFIRHECYADQGRCEIKTPDNRQAWVALSYEREVAKEVAYAFSRLIKALQRSNRP